MGTFLREVSLPPTVEGKLFLSRMPGRESSFEGDLDTIRARSIEHIICLAEMEDVPEDYRQALEKGRLATFARWLHFPIRDYGVPENREDLLLLARLTAELLQKGKAVLIHGGYGRGRTGMVAIMVLVALGLELPDAQERVREAGSFPQVSEQHQLVRWAAGRLAPDAAKEPAGD